ncbi:rod shape-determining protein MreC [Rubrobacter indicoceani]|uniref:rod shape-determining protein MreC n=1 Tax=Rubrobacter indicoceani TaxID=2051957 RepID=UPI000E5B2329|nr:rod shape-determining protein MreC [Rubrobacter indicoceani]
MDSRSGRPNPTSGFAALLILTVVSLALFTVYVREGDCSEGQGCGPLHTVQLGAAEVLSPAQGAVSLAARPFDGVRSGVFGVFGGNQRELEAELQEAQSLAARAAQLERENAELQELLGAERGGYEYAPVARVIAPVGEQLTQTVKINVGSDAGVRPEQPVIVGENTMIGRTTSRVSRNTAEVMLVTDQNFFAGVTIVPAEEFDPASGNIDPNATEREVIYGEGLLRTSIEGNFGVEYVELNARTETGDYVITSGRSGERELLFPPGLYIGVVQSVSSQDIEQYKKIVVDPAATPNDLNSVRVITGW